MTKEGHPVSRELVSCHDLDTHEYGNRSERSELRRLSVLLEFSYGLLVQLDLISGQALAVKLTERVRYRRTVLPKAFGPPFPGTSATRGAHVSGVFPRLTGSTT